MKTSAGPSILALAAALWIGAAVQPADAQTPPMPGGLLEFVPNQLIVLLDHGRGTPRPEEVVDAHGRGRELPAQLGVGAPVDVKFAIRHRIEGESRQAIESEPDSPLARSHRYLIFTYPPVVDLDAMAEALRKNPHVLHVEKNLIFEISATPSDPLFPVPAPPFDPTDYQWGSHFLNLPSAWDFAKGHAYVGLIDLGIDIDHPDLQAFDSLGSYVGGNFRPHFSYDFLQNDDCVDERNACPGNTPQIGSFGHGTHVSGIVAATADNGTGVAGACWNCSILMTRVSAQVLLDHAANSLNWLVRHGAQAVSMSWGHAGASCSGAAGNLGLFCNELALAEDYDVVLTASPGNDKLDIEFPASDSRVLSVGGIEPDGVFWDRADEGNGCPCDWPNPPGNCGSLGVPHTLECGSNYTLTPGSAMQDLTAPAKHVLSTFYVGSTYSPLFDCSDGVDGVVDGFGPCTGTSMSAPYVAAIAGLLRSVNPLLTKAEIRSALISNADRAGAWDPQFGYGVPDAAAAVQDVLGRVGGSVIPNRLTPLFQLYSYTTEDHVYTTVPQMGSAFTGGGKDYRPKGPDLAGYDYFPNGNCLFVPCPAAASVFIFSTDRSPNGHPLVPLYRMSFEGTFPGGPSNPDNADHTYTTETTGVEQFAAYYELDGIEGYVYERCTPEPSCIPTGAVRLYRLYNEARDDWAIFPESELAQWQADGYQTVPGWNPWIGYVYENVDSDADWLIDGFEGLIGTDSATADSDCDGSHDGAEFFKAHPYGDPLDGTCSRIVGEVGQVTNLTHASRTVLLSRSYNRPVVIAQPPSAHGSDPSVVRITSVQGNRFTFRIEEAPDRDGNHVPVTVSYLIVEAGNWKLPSGVEISAGRVSTSATVGQNLKGSFQTVTFPKAFSTAPLVLSQVETANDPSWVKTRQQPATATSVRLALEEEEASTTPHGTESIGWIAITPATGVWSGHRFAAASTPNAVTNAFHAITFGQSFASAPRFVGTLATYNDSDNSAVRFNNLTAGGVSVKVEEDTTFDPEVTHLQEVVSYVAIEGDGTLAASPR